MDAKKILILGAGVAVCPVYASPPSTLQLAVPLLLQPALQPPTRCRSLNIQQKTLHSSNISKTNIKGVES